MKHRFQFVVMVLAWVCCMISVCPAWGGNNSGAAFSTWPETGQGKCYNNTNEIPCPAEGQPFHGQDAQYNGRARSSTLLGGGSMVQDNVTGLIWEMKNKNDGIVDYNNPNDSDNTYTWCDTNTDTNGGGQGVCSEYDTMDFIIQLNKDNFGGYNDWRLPTITELVTLVNHGHHDPAVDDEYNASTKSGDYWSATTLADPKLLNYAFRVDFYYGYIYANFKSSAHHVRAVRGGRNPSSDQFVDNNDGTVTDTVTCLQWQKDSFGRLDWQNALNTAQLLNLAGHTDWRLPDQNELRSLLDRSHFGPATATVFASTTIPDDYWSSTTADHDSSYAWPVSFNNGGDGNISMKSNYAYGRAVRGHQCGTLIFPGSFVFDPIPSQVFAGVGFPVRVEARTAGGALDTSVNGKISLTANYGNIYPVMLHFVNGVAAETVTVYGEGTNKQLRVWQYGGREGMSDNFSTSGADSCWGSVTVVHKQNQVTVTLHDVISGAEVERRVGDISAWFLRQPCGKYFARVEKDGKRKEMPYAITGKPVVLDMHLTSGSKTPVVIIPGMMGSTHSGSSSLAPSLKGDFPDRALVIHASNLTGWEKMKAALESAGYPVVPCPWDWRNGDKDSMQESVETFLIPAINEALQYSTNSKVHLVAHSMGGLLARSYIQSDLYRGDVENLALVAVPNLGSANPYFLAEGGDTKTNKAVFGKTAVVLDNLYEKTIEKLWEKTYHNSFQGKKYRDCDAEGIKEFVANKGPGMLQLLFTGNFLTKNTGPAKIESPDYVNAWLNWLNAGEQGFHPPQDRFSADVGDKVKTRVFLGNKDGSTLRAVTVKGPAGVLYPDGRPDVIYTDYLGCGLAVTANVSKSSFTEYGAGDGTVPLESAQYPLTQGWADQEAKISETAHAYIMKDFSDEIIEFLNGDQAVATSEINKTAVATMQTMEDEVELVPPELAFSVQGATALLVTDRLGRRSGIVFATQEVVNEIPGAQVTSSDVASSVVIVNPVAGQYSLTYFGYEEDAFSLTITAVNGAGTLEEEEFEGYKPAAPQTMLVQYDPAATDQITAQPVVSAPGEMEEKPYACGASTCAALHWKASANAGVTGYVVYRKLQYGAIHTEMARVPATATSFNTGEAWNNEEGIPVNMYAVSAITTGEVESFFAEEKEEEMTEEFPWHMFLPAILGQKTSKIPRP